MKNHYNIYVQRGEEDDPCSGKGIDESESEKEQLLFKIRIEQLRSMQKLKVIALEMKVIALEKFSKVEKHYFST